MLKRVRDSAELDSRKKSPGITTSSNLLNSTPATTSIPVSSFTHKAYGSAGEGSSLQDEAQFKQQYEPPKSPRHHNNLSKPLLDASGTPDMHPMTSSHQANLNSNFIPNDSAGAGDQHLDVMQSFYGVPSPSLISSSGAMPGSHAYASALSSQPLNHGWTASHLSAASFQSPAPSSNLSMQSPFDFSTPALSSTSISSYPSQDGFSSPSPLDPYPSSVFDTAPTQTSDHILGGLGVSMNVPPHIPSPILDNPQDLGMSGGRNYLNPPHMIDSRTEEINSMSDVAKGKSKQIEHDNYGARRKEVTPVLDLSSRKGEHVGLNLGDFDMLETLGTGTFGKVILSRLRPSSSRPAQTQPHFFAVKVLEKMTVVRLRQVEHLNSERSTLAHVSHPFIVNLLCTFQDEQNLYLLLEYVQGGELFSHLRRAGRFSADVARFYAANLILALEYLHSQDIIYRDLKPENLLLDRDGYLKITDFGFAKHVTDRTYTLCGTPEYLAPEIITATGHGKAADFWAFGVLLYELLGGFPPFYADHPLEIYEKILHGKFKFPLHIDLVAKDLIKRLLNADLSKRLGNLKNGAGDVKAHRWFEGVDWLAVERKEIRAPIIPQTSTPGDTSNFERYAPCAIETMPGVLRAQRARQFQIAEEQLQRGNDPYHYLFTAF